MKRALLLTIGCAASIGVSSAVAQSAPTFHATVIGPPAGASAVFAFKTNNLGDFVGAAQFGTDTLPVLWLAGIGYVDVSVPVGETLTELDGINDDRIIVGATDLEAFEWSQTVGFIPIAPPAGYQTPHLAGINRRGDVIGDIELDGMKLRHPFLWKHTNHTMLIWGQNGAGISPASLNSRGSFIGTSKGGGHPRAVIASSPYDYTIIGPNGSASYGVDVNDYGAAALNVQTEGSATQAYLWTMNGKSGGLLSTGVPGNSVSSAIDNKKQILGQVSSASFTGTFLWGKPFGWVPLTSLLEKGTSLPDLVGEDMSERTIISGEATVDGVLSAVVLTPVSNAAKQ